MLGGGEEGDFVQEVGHEMGHSSSGQRMVTWSVLAVTREVGDLS